MPCLTLTLINDDGRMAYCEGDFVNNLRGFHCMLAYGDYTKEVAYAASKVGITVQTLKS